MVRDIQVLKRNSLFSLASAGTRLLSNSLLFILLARFYGAEAFGQFTTAHTLSTIFILLADFGFDMFLTTHVAQHKDADVVFPRMFGLKLLSSLLAAALMCALPLLEGMSPGARELTWILSLYMAFTALLNLQFALFKGMEQLHHEALIAFVMNAGLLGALVLMGVLQASLVAIATVFVLSRVLGLVIALLRTRRFVRTIIPLVDRSWVATVWKRVGTFGVFFLFGNLFFSQDTVLLSFWRGDVEVGIYQSVFRLIIITLLAVDVLVSALLPMLSRYFVEDRSQWNDLATLAGKTLLYAGLPVAVILFVYAEEIIDLVYGGGQFRDAVPILQVFAVTVLIRYAVETPALLLTTANRQHVRMVLVVGGTVFNLLANAYAIPAYGAIGAAVVSLITNAALGVAYVASIRDLHRMHWLSWQRLLPTLGTLALGAALWYLDVPLLTGVAAVLIVSTPLALGVGYTAVERQVLFQRVRG